MRGGIQCLPDALAGRLEEGVVRTNCRVTDVDLREKTVRVAGLGEVHYDRLVNTLPLSSFLDMIGALPAPVRDARRRLRWTTVWNLNLGVARRAVTDKHWIYFPEKKFPFYRVGSSSNFSSSVAPAGHSALYVEVARPQGARVDKARLEEDILGGLRECGLLRRTDELSARIWMPIEVGYVVYDFARTPSVKTIFRHLDGLCVESIGRYGAWKYSFMEETLLDGKRCAERLAGVASSSVAVEDGELRVLK
ncbi:MAG: FAD-dependent oxidoreductase [Elusimicrobiota bacterium]